MSGGIAGPRSLLNLDLSETGALMSLNLLEIDTNWAYYGHTTPLDPMAGFKEIMRLQPWLNPGDGVGHVIDCIVKLFPRLFNIFEIADVDTPSCRPVSANVTAYSVLSRNSGDVIRL